MSIDMVGAISALRALKAGDEVTLVRDGRECTYTVQREFRKMDGGGFGSDDHAAVTVGFGPGRFNFEVTPDQLVRGYVTWLR